MTQCLLVICYRCFRGACRTDLCGSPGTVDCPEDEGSYHNPREYDLNEEV